MNYCLLLGRLQDVLLDKDSLTVDYNYQRGEPREKGRKNQVRTQLRVHQLHRLH